MNNFFQQFGNSANQQPTIQPQINIQNKNSNNMMQRFMTFANNFKGDPKAKVQEMLNNGQMTQDQFDELSSMAQMFIGNMK